MSQRVFGTGQVILTPNGLTTPTPIQVGVCQDISYDHKVTVKKLYGNLQVAIDAGAGETTHGGKIKAMILNGPLIAALAGGNTTTTGMNIGVQFETWAIPGTPFQVTASHSATWVSDLGVWDITAAKYLTRVASAPATGQYSVAAGVYTFAAADTTHQVQLFYDYTSAAVGTTIKTVNTQMGAINYFQLKLYNNFTDSSGVANSGLYFPNVYFSDQSLAFKNTDFVAQDVTWEAIQDASGNVRSVWTGN